MTLPLQFLIPAGLRLTKNLKSFFGLYGDWTSFDGHEHVHKMSEPDIMGFVRGNQRVMVLFYAPWCNHCRAMKPEYAKAASILALDAPYARLAAVDCVAYPQALERFGIDHYPTLKVFKNGNYVIDYTGPRDNAAFVEFMKRFF